MKRWGSGDRFSTIIDGIRAEEPGAAFRSSFIVGFPGETEADHEAAARVPRRRALDWAGFFAFSRGGRHGRGRSRRRGRRRARSPSGCASAPRSRNRSRPRRGLRWSARRSRCSSTADEDGDARRPHLPRSARDRRRRALSAPMCARPARSCIARPRDRRRRSRSRRVPVAHATWPRPAACDRARRLARSRTRFGQSALGDAGQLRHARAGILVAIPTLMLIRDRGSSRGSRSRCWFAITVDRQPRRLARAPRRRDALGRVPRSRRRQADRARRARRACRPRRLPVVAGRGHRGTRARHLGLPLASPAGAASCCPRSGSGKYKAFTQYSRSASCCCR